VEENKIKEFIKLTTKSLSKSASRSKSKGNNGKNASFNNKPEKLLKVYLPEYELIKDENENNLKNKKLKAEKNKFKNILDNSIDVLRKQNKLVDTRSTRVKSEEAIRRAIDVIKPKLDKVIEEDFKKIIHKNIIFNKKSRSNSKNKSIKKLYAGKMINKGNTYNVNNRKSFERESEVSQYAQSNYNKKELINNSYNPENANPSIIERSQREYEFNYQQENFNNSSVLANERFNNPIYSSGTNQNSLSLSKFIYFFVI